jgi:hypothetical protein
MRWFDVSLPGVAGPVVGRELAKGMVELRIGTWVRLTVTKRFLQDSGARATGWRDEPGEWRGVHATLIRLPEWV